MSESKKTIGEIICELYGLPPDTLKSPEIEKMLIKRKKDKILKEMKDKGKTVVVVHHDLQSAIEYFDWMVMLNMRLVASGPTSEGRWLMTLIWPAFLS